MKSKQLFSAIFFLFVAQLFFACNTAKYYDFGAGSTAYRETKKAQNNPEAVKAENAPAATETASVEIASETENPVLEASAAVATPVLPARKVYEADKDLKHDKTTVAANPENKAPVFTDLKTKVEKKQKKGLFGGIKAIKATILEIVFAILLPPVAVALHEGITIRFWLSILLTLLFWIPGIIYAFLIITDTI